MNRPSKENLVFDIKQSLESYRLNYHNEYNKLPDNLKDGVHGVNYENGMNSDEIIGFMCGFLSARQKAQEEIEAIKRDNAELVRRSEVCYCAYCMDSVERTWNDLQSHMKTCEKHPLFLAKKEIKERDELIKTGLSYMQEAHNKFTPHITNSLALDWIEKAKQLTGGGR